MERVRFLNLWHGACLLAHSCEYFCAEAAEIVVTKFLTSVDVPIVVHLRRRVARGLRLFSVVALRVVHWWTYRMWVADLLFNHDPQHIELHGSASRALAHRLC